MEAETKVNTSGNPAKKPMDKKIKIAIGVLVVVAVAALLIYEFLGPNSSNNQYIGLPVSASDMQALSSIANNQTLANRIGVGAIGTFPVKVNGTALTLNGKPGVIYVGAEFCPYCAATRWGLILAFMRFGTFTGLQYMASTGSDVFPDTPTFSFVNATYSSSYVTFSTTEIEDRNGSRLQTLTAIDNATLAKYGPSGSIPFIDFGNKTVQQGADYSPGTINKYTWDQVISQLSDTNSTVSQSVIGSADVFTAQICNADGFQPASVCDAPYIGRILNMS